MTSSTPRAGLCTELPPHQWLENGDGRRIAFSSYPAKKPWLHLLISHGFGEHRGWYDHIGQFLSEKGISTYIYDQFHHGLSDGNSADPPHYSALTEGLRLAYVQGVEPQMKKGDSLAVMGHSNGGLVALKTLNQFPAGRPAFLVLSNPLLGFPPAVETLFCWFYRGIGHFFGQTRLPTHSNPARNTSNQAVWPDYHKDPLRFRSLTLRFLFSMTSNAKSTRENLTSLDIPVLLLSGEKDKIANPLYARRWFEKLKAPEKKLVNYPTLRHELLNEVSWQGVLEDMISWLKSQK